MLMPEWPQAYISKWATGWRTYVAFKLPRHLLYLALIVFTAIQLGSQSITATVAITSFPDWGQDGSVSGIVYGIAADQVKLYLFEFIPDVGWVSVPGCGDTSIQSTGQFSANATPNLINRNATRISVYLVPASLAPVVPCVGGAATIPFIVIHNALSSSTYPRLANYKTVSFGGLDWFIKTAQIEVSPPNQFFIDDDVFVDTLNRLHPKVTKCSGSWCSAEIFTKQVVGYGSYNFTIDSPVNDLDPNLTLGLFTWDAQAGDQSNREWDIEFSRWGNVNNSGNAQYVLQPYDGPDNMTRFLMSPAGPSFHTVTWNQNQVTFLSAANTA